MLYELTIKSNDGQSLRLIIAKSIESLEEKLGAWERSDEKRIEERLEKDEELQAEQDDIEIKRDYENEIMSGL